MSGLSTTGSISFGMALVAGRKRVPSPPTGKTALRMGCVMRLSCFRFVAASGDNGKCFLLVPPAKQITRRLSRLPRKRYSRFAPVARRCSAPKQQLARLVDLIGEIGRAAVARIDFSHEPAIGLLDVAIAGAWFQAEDGIRVGAGHC